MRTRRAIRSYFRDLVASAPNRQPPQVSRRGRHVEEPGRTAWVLGCAAALAVLLVLPAARSPNLGSRALGARIERTLESGAIQELGASALKALAESPLLRPKS
jgi:hypothetical protein